MDNTVGRERQNERSPGFNVGSASIIMVFAILCLTIFSVLSLITTNSDLRLSRRAAKSIEDYYKAEYEAETRVLAINNILKNGEAPASLPVLQEGVSVEEMPGGSVKISFLQAVDEKKDLRVSLERTADGKLSVTGWKLMSNDNWNPDTGMDVWTGN